MSIFSSNPVYLYYPNLVGYGRIISTVIAFWLVFSSPPVAAVFYATGQLLDAVDGIVARHFNQCSRFGAVLDMLTDRMSTAVLLIVLSHLYRHAWGLFTALIVLDIVSHWCQMYSKLMQQASTHKGSKNALLNFYYTAPYALLVHCVGNEACFITLYLLPHCEQISWLHSLLTMVLYFVFPVCVMKQFMNVIQLYDSCSDIASLDWMQARQQQAQIKQQQHQQVS